MDNYEQLSAAVEDILRTRLADRGDIHPREADLGAIVEQASAAISRVISENLDADTWLYFRLPVRSEVEAFLTLSQSVAPTLRDLKKRHTIRGWWWLNKRDLIGPAVRLRIHIPSDCKKEIERAITEHFAALDLQFSLMKYEPEMRLFGGPIGISLAHDHFCVDSEFLTDWAGQDAAAAQLPIVPTGLSLALIFQTLRAAGLDLFECWDVFDRVCDKRPSAEGSGQTMLNFERLAKKVINSGPDRIFELYDGERLVLLKEHVAFIDSFGSRVNRAYFEGKLECGIREFLTAIIFFHWNRVGMPGLAQSKLASTVAQELAHLSRRGATHREGRAEN